MRPNGMGGYQLMIADEIFRGRYAKSFETPQPIKPGAVNEYTWSLHGADHTFLKGHRIMVEVQSSWFPLYDRNPQTFVPNIMTAPADAYKAQTETIYGSPKYPSHLEFSVPEIMSIKTISSREVYRNAWTSVREDVIERVEWPARHLWRDRQGPGVHHHSAGGDGGGGVSVSHRAVPLHRGGASHRVSTGRMGDRRRRSGGAGARRAARGDRD